MRTLFIFILAGIAFISCAQTGTISDGEGGLSARTKINATITKANNHADSIVAHVAKIDENTSDITALELISDSSYAKADVGRLEIDTIADISDDSIIIDVGYLNLIRDLYLTSEADSGIELRNYVTGEKSSQVFVYDGYAGMVSNVGDDYVGAAGHSGVWVDTSDVEIYVMNSDGINTSGIYIDRLEMLVTDDINEKGLVYNADYSANYTARSLPDSAAVAAMIAGSVTPYDSAYINQRVDSIWNEINDSIVGSTIYHTIADTLQFVGGWGDGLDSTGCNLGARLGMFNVVQDNAVLDSTRIRCTGDDGDVTVQWRYGDWGTAGTELHSVINVKTTDGWVGTSTFSTGTVPNGNDIWGIITAKNYGCTAIRAILFYHETRN